jgi:hypothetical protein
LISDDEIAAPEAPPAKAMHDKNKPNAMTRGVLMGYDLAFAAPGEQRFPEGRVSSARG